MLPDQTVKCTVSGAFFHVLQSPAFFKILGNVSGTCPIVCNVTDQRYTSGVFCVQYGFHADTVDSHADNILIKPVFGKITERHPEAVLEHGLVLRVDVRQREHKCGYGKFRKAAVEHPSRKPFGQVFFHDGGIKVKSSAEDRQQSPLIETHAVQRDRIAKDTSFFRIVIRGHRMRKLILPLSIERMVAVILNHDFLPVISGKIITVKEA